MTDFSLHPGAYADLDSIWEHIASDNLDAADRVLAEILSTIGRLVRFPNMGHRRSDLTSRPLRFQLVREFLIAYAPREKPLLILAVLHGRRSPRLIASLLRERE